MADGSVSTTTKTDTKPHGGRALDRELYCPRLEHLLMGSAAELGQRGNLAQVVASIERGGVGGGGEDPNLGMLRRLGATDTRGIDNRISRLRELELRWRLLTTAQRATALAHYLGTTRAHATLRERFGAGQGGLAGVVLWRWQARQTKGRQRVAQADCSKLGERLAAVRAALEPIDAETKALCGLSRAVAPIPNLPKPTVRQAEALAGPDGDAEALHTDRVLEWHQTVLAHRAVARFLAGLRALDIDRQLASLHDRRLPLQAEQERLCAALADAASLGAAGDDEEALVRLCRSGNLDPGAHLAGAEADVRALHRAWKATAAKLAKAWVDDDGAGEPAA